MKVIRRIIFLFQLITISLLIVTVYTSNIHQTKNHSKRVHETLYLDYKFTETEKEYIMSAAYEWQEATDHLVTFDIEMLPSNRVLDFDNGILIKKVDSTDPDIIAIDSTNSDADSALGFYNGDHPIPHIKLCASRISPEIYKTVVMHELGHFLGLSHAKGIDGIQTLMYPSVNLGSDRITREDLISFCKIHGCNAKKLSNY